MARALRDYPVLLVDPQAGGVCSISTIGHLSTVLTGNRPKAMPPAGRGGPRKARASRNLGRGTRAGPRGNRRHTPLQ